jgi:hypothetical protein
MTRMMLDITSSFLTIFVICVTYNVFESARSVPPGGMKVLRRNATGEEAS